MNRVKRKKTELFLSADGKCEYCGCDMILSFAEGHKNKNVPNNLATLDHLYNRDHDLRLSVCNEEKRIFIVCVKCNGEKSKVEPNNQVESTPLKTAKKITPKNLWSDEDFMNKIIELVEREKALNYKNSEIDNQIKRLQHEKNKNIVSLSKTAKYRNQISEDRLKELSDGIEVLPQNKIW